MPALRQVSATGTPSSLYLMTKAFCASVNFDAFIASLLPTREVVGKKP